MRKRSLLPLCLLGLTVWLLFPAGALAAPSIKSVTPKKISVGQTLTIRGKGFKPGKGKNTVIFKSDGLFARAKAHSATRTRLRVKVPAKLTAYMKRRGARVLATRFQVRVNARGSRYTSRRRSPVVSPAKPVGSAPDSPAAPGSPGKTGSPAPASQPAGAGAGTPAPPPDCDLDGTPDDVDADDDNDLLSDDQELGFVHKTNPCNPDSDGDGVEDGYEWQSAQDLNDSAGVVEPIPYPGKKPYPNPLFADAGTDYDGDSLTLSEEYSAWIRYSADGILRVGRPATLASLLYSDGTQTSQNVPIGSAPAWVTDLNTQPPGVLSDEERDADSDGLPNFDETHGRLTYAWWKGAFDSEKDYFLRPFGELDFLDSDSDGDGVLDGQDDQDNDDLQNVEEVSRDHKLIDPAYFMMVNPYNPCMPDPSSRSCTRHPPFQNPPAPFSAIDPRFAAGSAYDLSGDIAGAFPAPYVWP